MEKIKANAKQVILTVLMFGWIAIALLGGFELLGITALPTSFMPYLGAALIGYVIAAGIAVTNMCVKFILKKEK